MALTAAGYAAALGPMESSDPVVQTVAKNVRSIVKESGIEQEIPDLKIFFPDFSQIDFGPKKPRYYTEACVSVLPSTVVVNARFLLNTEAAIRSFGLFDELFKTFYLKNDACMFGLVKRIRSEEGEQWLNKLREFEEGKKSAERYAVDELTMTALFFCAHEIGHLNDDVNLGRYGAFLNPAKPLETRLANAASKLRRHASEFDTYGFDLPGWKGVITPGHEAFQAVDKIRRTIPKEEAKDEEKNVEWFQNEISADDAAVRFMIRFLKDQPAKRRWLLVRGLFAASLHSWYKDFLTFCELIPVPRRGPKPMLSFELMKNPEGYIKAASLFGDVHRCTIMRSTLAIQEILEAHHKSNGANDEEDGGATILSRASSLWSRLFGAAEPAKDESERHFDLQSARRQLLLAIHMDTVVKLAYFGASMPWMVEKEREQGSPPIVMMQFDAIDQSVNRLKKMINEN